MNYWTTKDGNKIAVEDLSAEHLLNILNMLKNNNPESFYGMRISRIDNNSLYSIEKNREQLNKILGESVYITNPRQQMIDDVIRWNQEKIWEYECETGIDFDNRQLI